MKKKQKISKTSAVIEYIVVHRLYPLLFLALMASRPLSAEVSVDWSASLSHGTNVLGGENYGIFRAPTGLGTSVTVGGFWKGLTAGIGVDWYGYPAAPDETSFDDSRMLTYQIRSGWAFNLLRHDDSGFYLFPALGLGFYSRKLVFEGAGTWQTRPMLSLILDSYLITDPELIFGLTTRFSGYFDEKPVWSFSFGLMIGYRFGGKT